MDNIISFNEKRKVRKRLLFLRMEEWGIRMKRELI